MAQANGRDTLANDSVLLHSRISSLGALTIKIISAEIGERLVETFLDARVPGAPELAGDLWGNMSGESLNACRHNYSQAEVYTAAAGFRCISGESRPTKISDLGTPEARIPSPTSFSFPYALERASCRVKRCSEGPQETASHHAQSMAL